MLNLHCLMVRYNNNILGLSIIILFVVLKYIGILAMSK